MRASPWRLLLGTFAAVLSAAVLGFAVGSAADSQSVAAFTFGAVLLAAWLGFMVRIRLRLTNAEGGVFRFHPLYVFGISVLIGASSLLLADLPDISLPAFAVGLILAFMGRRRSGLVGRS
jgi:hypothetical protein